MAQKYQSLIKLVYLVNLLDLELYQVLKTEFRHLTQRFEKQQLQVEIPQKPKHQPKGEWKAND